ncbi:SCO family protein [Pseudomonas sp. Marseille-QA0892]
MSRTQKLLFPLIALLLVLMGAVLYQVLSGNDADERSSLLEAGIVLLPQPRDLPAMEMIDQDERPVALNELKGQWSLLFFGYTFCPDICPTTLAELRQLDERLPADVKDRLQMVLVTVDPERDTPQQLKEYLAYFSPDFVGLNGSMEQITALASRVSIPFIPPDTSKPGYTVDHSGNLVVIGPDGTQRGFIRSPLDVDKLTEQLPRLMAQ